MTDDLPPLDEALEVATNRTKAAEERFLKTPPTSADRPEEATEVVHRAEDLNVLARDVVDKERND
jgi:hypothetical protein